MSVLLCEGVVSKPRADTATGPEGGIGVSPQVKTRRVRQAPRGLGSHTARRRLSSFDPGLSSIPRAQEGCWRQVTTGSSRPASGSE